VADRLFSVVRRRKNLVDMIMPKQSGVVGYRVQGATNFDATFQTMFTAPISSGYVGEGINTAVLNSIPGDYIRAVFDPDKFSALGLADNQHMWLRFVPVDVAGTPGTPGAASLVLTADDHAYGRVTISGGAPNEVSVADSQELHLPLGMKNFVFLNQEAPGGNSLFLAFEPGGPEVEIVAGERYDAWEGQQAVILVRGDGGVVNFSANFTFAFPVSFEIEGGAQEWSGQQLVYVGKQGDDANDGSSEAEAVLTIAAALSLAAGMTPAINNRVAVVILDAGTYTESFTVPSWVNLYGPLATVEGNVVLEDDADVTLHELQTASGIGVSKLTGSSTSRFNAEAVTLTGTAVGALNAGVGSVLIYHVETTYVQDGFGVGDISTSAGHVHLVCEDIYLSGTGTAVAVAGTGTIVGQVTHITEQGAGIGNGTGFNVAGGQIDLSVSHLDTTAAYTVAAGAELNLFCAYLSGTETLAVGGVANVVTPASYRALVLGEPGQVTAVAVGASYEDVQTTPAIFAANNQARKLGVKLDVWETAASLKDYGDLLQFHVARLNDGTVHLRCLTDGQDSTGAVPLTMTGLIPDGVGWRLVVDATYQVVVGVGQDASLARWAKSVIFLDGLETRTTP
jgi:hypothetical protein